MRCLWNNNQIGMIRKSVLSPLFYLTCILLPMTFSIHAVGARMNPPDHPGYHGQFAPPFPPPINCNDPAQKIMFLYLRSGLTQSYVGKQTTRLLFGRSQESRQIVKHEGPGRERIEYLSPSDLAGEILLLSGHRVLIYKPGKPGTIYEGLAPESELKIQTIFLMKQIFHHKIDISIVGNQKIAGKSTDIVEIRPTKGGAAFKRFWIDAKTGVRLKTEDVDAHGSTISTSYFTSIDYNYKPNPRDFSPESLPDVPHVLMFPNKPPFATIEEAEAKAGYDIKAPAVRPGFHLNGIWVTPGFRNERTTILRYTDGVNTFALFERPINKEHATSWMRRPEAHELHFRDGAAVWASEDRIYTILGNLRRESIVEIYNSLR
jgi:outer membrane lipoprotein-sorting protein